VFARLDLDGVCRQNGLLILRVDYSLFNIPGDLKVQGTQGMWFVVCAFHGTFSALTGLGNQNDFSIVSRSRLFVQASWVKERWYGYW
jgi:hypothetical protein